MRFKVGDIVIYQDRDGIQHENMRYRIHGTGIFDAKYNYESYPAFPVDTKGIPVPETWITRYLHTFTYGWELDINYMRNEKLNVLI